MQPTVGHPSEEKACHFLQKQGLTLLTKNYRCVFGEIDLVMQDNSILVFIEVRFRAYTAYGDTFESIDGRKQEKLLKSATHYLQKKHLIDKIDCRFDVVGLTNHSIDWIKDAFSYE